MAVDTIGSVVYMLVVQHRSVSKYVTPKFGCSEEDVLDERHELF